MCFLDSLIRYKRVPYIQANMMWDFRGPNRNQQYEDPPPIMYPTRNGYPMPTPMTGYEVRCNPVTKMLIVVLWNT